MKIQDALRSVPSKPGIALALVATALFGAWHFYTGWRACENRALAAEDIKNAIALAQDGNGIVDIAELFAFAWDEMHVLHNHHPGENALACPFGNHWSLDERRAFARDDNFAALVLSSNGTVVAFVEYIKEWGDFQAGESPLPRESARFRLRQGHPPQLFPIQSE